MIGYTVVDPIGNYRPIRTVDTDLYEGLIPWRLFLHERLELLLQNTFTASSQSEFIFNISDIVKNTINAVTIEKSLLFLQYYLGFRFPNPGKVIDYLQKHRNLYDIVLYACILTDERFGQNAQMSLELYQDPEINDEYLTIYVRQNTYEPDLIDKIDRVSVEFENILKDEREWLLITTAVRPPLEGIMPFGWAEFLDIARFLHNHGNAAAIPQEAAYRCAISRAYYAAFCHSRCYATVRMQYIPEGNEEDHKKLRKHLSHRGLPDVSRNLDRLRQWRNNCDYDNPTPTATETTVINAIIQADRIVTSLQLP